jgi:hypothetical protein
LGGGRADESSISQSPEGSALNTMYNTENPFEEIKDDKLVS